MKKTTKFCPICEDDRQVEEICEDTEVEVRGETFTVKAHYFRCPECGEEFEASSTGLDPLATAYMEYRRRHNMLTPTEIRDFRHKYELTQKELSTLLGLGAVTLSRYENGALQDLSHDRQLQEAMTPDGLLKLIELTPRALGESKRKRLESILKGQREARCSVLSHLEEHLSSVPPSIMNGFQRFNLEKFFGVVEYFCSNGGVLKTKLNKLLFYADFLHFKEHSVSITGVQYARLPQGPCPENYQQLLAVMEEYLNILETAEVDCPGKEYTGENVFSQHGHDIDSLSPTELGTITYVAQLFYDKTTSDIRDLSHREQAWKEVEPSRHISYQYSRSLLGYLARY